MSKITVPVPRSLNCPLTKIRMKHPSGESETVVDSTALENVEIELPDGVTEEQVQLVGEYCDVRGQRDEGMGDVQIKFGKSEDVPPAPQDPPAPKDPPPAAEVVMPPPAADAAPAPAADAAAAPAGDSAAVVPAADATPSADAAAAGAADASATPKKSRKS
jgi:hypothetical protein